MTPQSNPSPDYGRRLLPSLIDQNALHDPDHIIYSICRTADPADGFQDISNKEYANAINRAAWWLEETLGKCTTFETIGYIGPNDLRYPILIFAAAKVGFKMLLNSPRNSLEGHLKVIAASDCNIWLVPSQKLPIVDRFLERRPMKAVALPELAEFLDKTTVPHYPYEKTFDEARDEPLLVLHTSGSTGLPKPIIVTNGLISTTDAQHLVPPIEGKKLQVQHWISPIRSYSCNPPFHSAGVTIDFGVPVFYGLTVVYGPPLVPVNLQLIDAMHKYGNVQGSMLAPSTLEEIAYAPESLELLKNHEFVVSGGGPVSEDAGELIMSKTRLMNIIGTTEGSLFAVVVADPEDWKYFHFHPSNGFDYRENSDGLYEQFQVKDPKYDLNQGLLRTFPGNEVSVKDLYSKHPTKPGRWLYRGRSDDILVLTNGEKLNPLDMEACINNHPAVLSTLIVGQAKFQTAALIELLQPPPDDEEEKKRLLESIWEFVEEANSEAPAHAKLQKSHIMFATAGKPFLRAGKGTPQRVATLALYDEEIEELYREADERAMADVPDLTGYDLEQTTDIVKMVCSEITGLNELRIGDDMFAAGVDSLSVFSIVRRLRAILAAQKPMDINPTKLNATTVYTNPTIAQLSSAFYKIIHPEFNEEEIRVEETSDQMDRLLHTYALSLPELSTPSLSESLIDNHASVILTGSTGSLGSYLLNSLMSMPNVSQIYCLNRSANSQEKQTKINISRGLNTDFSSKVQFLHADLSRPYLGLEKSQYHEIANNATHIIHNSWQVDFNLSLASFEPHIRGVRHLIDLSLESRHRATIFFVSSIGVALNWKSESPVPEALIDDFTVAEGGYGTSKLVAEWLLEKASRLSGVKATVCRVGQIAGPVKSGKGMWNRQEWLPTIISTSKYLQLLPSDLGSLDRVDWIPVDILAEIILELSGLQDQQQVPPPSFTDSGIEIFHTVNPSAQPWSRVLSSVTRHLSPAVKIVSWSEWVQALHASAVSSAEVAQNPGIKLLDFYEKADLVKKSALAVPVLMTGKAEGKSGVLRGLGPVTTEWMELWMRQWGG